MNILVTGCAGFIGSKVSELLLKEGHTVIGVDNLNQAYDPRLKEWRLKQLQSYPLFQFHSLDISHWTEMDELFNKICGPGDHSVSAVINLAARAGVRQSLENPWVYYETNVKGSLNLLELCKKHGIKKFVLASTSSLYGNSERPFKETLKTDSPLSPYAASKKGAEALCFSYHHLYGIDVTVFRYFTVYGPAGRPDMSLYRFISWTAEGQEILLYGDGSQERDFTYVEDIARGTILGLKPVGYEIINLGSDEPYSIQHLIHLVEERLGKKAKYQNKPFHPADVPATWADISKARSLLGWEPQVHLEDGVRQSVNWYLENREWAAQCIEREK
jgi:nucleoside-diphosphate-sugar epimerase